MAALTLQTISTAGLTPALVAASSGGDTVGVPSGDERVFIQVKNAGGSAITVTINPISPTSVRAVGAGVLPVPAISVSVPATTGEKLIGPIPSAYIDASSNVNIAYSAVTSVTVGAFRLAPASI